MSEYSGLILTALILALFLASLSSCDSDDEEQEYQPEEQQFVTPFRHKRKNFTPRFRMMIMERDRFRCQICGVVGNPDLFEIDHVISLENGGTNDIHNLQTLCMRCNRVKGACNG